MARTYRHKDRIPSAEERRRFGQNRQPMTGNLSARFVNPSPDAIYRLAEEQRLTEGTPTVAATSPAPYVFKPQVGESPEGKRAREEFESKAYQAKIAGTGAGYVPSATPVQSYQDAQVARIAGLPGAPGGAPAEGAGVTPQAPAGASLLAGGQTFADTGMYFNPQVYKDEPVYKQYQEDARRAIRGLDESLARMPSQFQSAQQATDWLKTQPFYRPELGATLNAALETRLDRINPAILNRVREENKQIELRRSLERRAEEAGPEYAVGIGPKGEWALMPKDMTPLEMKKEKRQMFVRTRLQEIEDNMDSDRMALDEGNLSKQEYDRRAKYKMAEQESLFAELSGEQEEPITPSTPQEQSQNAMKAMQLLTTALERTDLSPAARQALQDRMDMLSAFVTPAPDVAPGGRGTITDAAGGVLAETGGAAPAPVTPPAPPVPEIDQQAARKAEIIAQLRSQPIDEAEIAGYVRRKIQSGVLKVADITSATGAKVAKEGLKKYTELFRLPFNVAKWEAQLGRTALNRFMIFVEDKIYEERAEKQLAKEAQK